MKKHLMPAIRIYLFLTILLGLAYPLIITGISQVIFPSQANGEFANRGGQIVGSKWIAQKFERPEYFWPRPSAIDYNPLPSGGTNQGPTSADLKKAFEERRVKMKMANPDMTSEPPSDLLFASGSGLDPHISIEAAQYQLARVAKARSLSVEQVQESMAAATQGRQWGFLGEATVNVLALNLSLDKAQGIDKAPQLVK